MKAQTSLKSGAIRTSSDLQGPRGFASPARIGVRARLSAVCWVLLAAASLALLASCGGTAAPAGPTPTPHMATGDEFELIIYSAFTDVNSIETSHRSIEANMLTPDQKAAMQLEADTQAPDTFFVKGTINGEEIERFWTNDTMHRKDSTGNWVSYTESDNAYLGLMLAQHAMPYQMVQQALQLGPVAMDTGEETINNVRVKRFSWDTGSDIPNARNTVQAWVDPDRQRLHKVEVCSEQPEGTGATPDSAAQVNCFTITISKFNEPVDLPTVAQPGETGSTLEAATSACGTWEITALDRAQIGGPLTAVAVLSENDIWIAGSSFAVGPPGKESNPRNSSTAHWDGSIWTPVQVPGAERGYINLSGLAAFAPDDVWAVGSQRLGEGNATPLALHWDGKSWNAATLPGLTGRLNAVTGSGPDDVWAVGTGMQIAHWDGKAWSRVRPTIEGTSTTSTFENLNDVTAISKDDAWAVGDNTPRADGTAILHWDGKTWQAVRAGTDGAASGIGALSGDDIWVVGDFVDRWSADTKDEMLFLHWTYGSWRVVPGPAGQGAEGLVMSGGTGSVAGASAGDVWAITDDRVWHWDGTEWSGVHSPADSETDPGLAVRFLDLATLPDGVLAVGRRGDSIPLIARFTRSSEPCAKP